MAQQKAAMMAQARGAAGASNLSTGGMGGMRGLGAGYNSYAPLMPQVDAAPEVTAKIEDGKV